MEVYLLTCTILFLTFYFWKVRRSAKLPPGPTGLPILGYIPFLTKDQPLIFTNLKKKYGDVFSLYLGQRLMVILSSYDVVKEVFVKQGNNFSGRAAMVSTIPPEFTDTKGIIFNQGDSWLENKQITINILKTFCRDKSLGETVVMNEIQYFLQEVNQHQGQPKDIFTLIHYSIVNISWLFMFGKRIDFNDKTLEFLLLCAREHIDAIQFAGCEMAFPTIFKIPFVQKIFSTFVGMNTYRQLHKYCDGEVNKIEALSHDNNTTFCLVSEWFQTYPKENPKFDYYRNQLIAIIIDLTLASTEATTVFLQWAVLYMAEHPNVQRRLQNEIDEIIGRTNFPTMADQIKMPYTDATIMEIHRIVSVGPLSAPRINSETAQVRGYTIPEDTLVIANMWAIHHDPKIYPNPEEFNPDRFLENGRSKKVAELIPFCVGKRQCLGEILARLESFLFLVSVLQRFTIKKPPGVKLNFNGKIKLANHPLPQNIHVIPRD